MIEAHDMSVSKKNNRNRWKIAIAILITLIVAGILIGLIYFKRVVYSRKPIFYNAFGISIPTDYALHGIDVSHYQHRIDWNAVSSMRVDSLQLHFSFVKATEGTTHTDRHFARNWDALSRTRLVRGAYHYFRARTGGKAQANHFIRQVRLRSGDLPPVLDVEELDGATASQLVTQVREWVRRVEDHYGVKPIIYTGVQFYNRYLARDFSDYPLWIAHYYQPRMPRIGHRWMFWQHSDRGRVNGIRNPVDFNVFYGTKAAFDALRIP